MGVGSHHYAFLMNPYVWGRVVRLFYHITLLSLQDWLTT